MSRKKTKKAKRQVTKKNQPPKKNSAKIPLLSFTIALVAVIAVGYFAIRGNNDGYVNAKDAKYDNTSSIETSQVASSSTAGDVEFAKLRGGETKPVLSPARFKGRTASSYQVARENPALLDAMYCYCYCKKTIGHKSLLSCFTDGHASKCTICQDQAFSAKRMLDKGLDIGEIRKEVDKKFWRPFS